MNQPTIIASYIRHLLAAAKSLGADIPRALTKSGIAVAPLEDPDARIALTSHHLLWQHLSAEVGRENLGLAGHLVAQCGTALEALAVFTRYRNLVGGDQIVPRLHPGDDYLEVRYAPVEPAFAQSAHSGESGMISLLMLTQSLSGIRCVPLEAWFQHKRPADLRIYEEFFPCPIYFEKPYRRLLLPRDITALKFNRADRALSRYLSHHADVLLQRLRPERSVAERVRAHLAPALREGEPQESLIARQLGMSPRTLQRYLRAEGVTFGKILDEVRHELALHYLRDRTLGVTEVAFLLGYSDPSTFFRAFRRWTGTTPHKTRMQP
jgi:AraC-like DNA-binding protein